MHPEVKRQVFEGVRLADLKQVATQLLRATMDVKVIVFIGEMGSGKTTFVKALGEVVNVGDTMSSPTFSIVNEYQASSGETFFHFDFYRIKNESEAYDIGTEEYFDSGSYCFVEWPEKIPSLLPPRYVEVLIKIEDETHRTIAFSIHEG